MKKKFFVILAVLVSMAMAAPVFAEEWSAWESGDATLGTTDTVVVSLSPGVHIDYNTISVGTNNGAAYCMATSNENGTRVYGAQFNFQGIIMSSAEYDFVNEDAPVAPDALGGWDAGVFTVMGGDGTLPTSGGS